MPELPVYQQVHQAAVDTCKHLVEKYNKEADPKRRIELRHKLGRTYLRTYSLQVLHLDNRRWNRYCRERLDLLYQAKVDIGKAYLDSKLARGEVKSDDLELLAYEGELAERFKGFRLSKTERKSIPHARLRERATILMLLDTLHFYLAMQVVGFALEPLSRLNSLVERRFEGNQNWVLAAATLSAHENLIKRKLADLGVSEEEIARMSKSGGLFPLVDVLEREILAKESRRVSLEFYRSSALRKVRNAIEHEGYHLKISQGEMLDLLRDVERFERELYKSGGPGL